MRHYFSSHFTFDCFPNKRPLARTSWNSSLSLLGGYRSYKRCGFFLALPGLTVSVSCTGAAAPLM